MNEPFHRNDTPGILAMFVDKDGNLTNPSNHEIKVFDPSGTLKIGPITNPTEISVGLWEYYPTIPDDADYGDWTLTWKMVKGSYVRRVAISFTVEELEGD